MKKSTWILLAVVAALFCIVFFWERKIPTTDEIKRSEEHLITFNKDNIVSIIREGASPFKLEKRDGKWKVLKPVADEGDHYRIEGFLDRLAGAKVVRKVQGNYEATKYGLDKPDATLTLAGEEKTHEIMLGRKGLLDGIYAQGDVSLAVISEDTKKLLLSPSDEFRLKDLLSENAEDVVSCSVNGGKLLTTFTREGKEEWKITSPFKDRADEGKVQELIDDVCLCRVVSFYDDLSLQYAGTGLPSSTDVVELKLKSGKKVEVRIGSMVPATDPKKNLVYVSVSGRPSVMGVSRNSLRFIGKKPEEYRSLDLFNHQVYDAKQIEIEGKRKLKLKRDAKEGWGFTKPEKASAESDASVIAAGVSALKAVSVVDIDRKSAGLEHPAFKVSLSGNRFSDSLEVGKSSDGKIYAAPGGRRVILRLEPDSWKRFEETLVLSKSPGKKKEAAS